MGIDARFPNGVVPGDIPAHQNNQIDGLQTAILPNHRETVGRRSLPQRFRAFFNRFRRPPAPLPVTVPGQSAIVPPSILVGGNATTAEATARAGQTAIASTSRSARVTFQDQPATMSRRRHSSDSNIEPARASGTAPAIEAVVVPAEDLDARANEEAVLGMNRIERIAQDHTYALGMLPWLEQCAHAAVLYPVDSGSPVNAMLTAAREQFFSVSLHEYREQGGSPENARRIQDCMQNHGSVLKLEYSTVKLPECIGNLDRLHDLSLKQCVLEDVENWIANLFRLTDLALPENELQTLPAWVADMTNLRRLNVKNNLLAELPEWLADLRKLEDFELQGNQLQELPASLAGLSQLVKVEAAGNPLQSLAPALARLPGGCVIRLSKTTQTEREVKVLRARIEENGSGPRFAFATTLRRASA